MVRSSTTSDPSFKSYQASRQRHWDTVAHNFDDSSKLGRYYQQRLFEIYRHLVPPGLSVLEIGCGQGSLLASVEPKYGVGLDFSSEMIRRAQQRHPLLHFAVADAHVLPIRGPFEIIILSDLVNDVWDVQLILENIRHLCSHNTRIIFNFYSQIWQVPLRVAQKFGLAKPNLQQNWLTVTDLNNLLTLTNLEIVRHWAEILLPLPSYALSGLFNRFLVKLWPFHYLALTNMIVARPIGTAPRTVNPTVSVIIPARNEAGNIPAVVDRTPEMGAGTELIFVEGHSQDDTYSVIEHQLRAHPERIAKLYKQTGIGKGNAVRKGFGEASGDILMILDADLTVPPEDLIRFYTAIQSGKGEFINGVRLVYPMEQEAMRFLNMLGNKFFSQMFSWLLGQKIRDTLCGTKVIWSRDYQQLAANRAYFGDFDPFGDFDLLLGAARQNLKILELPIRYRQRVYGDTNISRFRHGLLLLRMVVIAARRLKFV